MQGIFRIKKYSKKILITLLIGVFIFSGFSPLEFMFGSTSSVSKSSSHFSSNEIAHAAINAAEKEYIIDTGPVTGSTTANYVFATFFNPSGSGRTAAIKHLIVRADTASSTASNYVNLTVRRITAASAGTQITQANFPQKNASSSNSVIEIRYNGVTSTFSGSVDSRIFGQPLSGAVGSSFSERDIQFGSSDEKIVLQPGEGIAVYQEAAGVASTKARIVFEWDETANAPSSSGEFLFAFPRVAVASSTNFVYNSFFNPSASGKSAVVKRIWYGTETCSAAAVYTNSLVLKRISAASVGTAIAASNIPKKNTGSTDSVMEFRYNNAIVTQVGGTDTRLGHMTPCGAAGQSTGWQKIDFDTNDEKLILQAGEGIALITEGASNANQIVRMIVEWQEVTTANTPASLGEYIFASGKVASSTALNATSFSFFNPVGSGKSISIKRLDILANATTAAAYTSYQWRRITAASGGTLIAASDLPKKHTGTANSIAEMRWCLQGCDSIISATYAGTVDARLLSVTGAGAVGQTIGEREIVFGSNEKIVLQPGEGIALYNDVLIGSVAEAVKVLIEWDEDASTPASQGEYLMDIGPINGNVATTYNFISFFNPVSSGKNAVFRRIGIRVDTIANAVYIPIQLRRITSSSGGTVVASSSYPKKHTGTATSSMEIRTTGVVVTYAGATSSSMLGVQTPGTVGSVIAGNTGYKEIIFTDSEPLVLKPGEGIVLYQTPTAGDISLRIRMLAEWAEQASAPTALGEFMSTIGPINQSLVANFVYATLFNPITSASNYIVRKLGMQVDRSGAATTPTYTPVAIRRIVTASAGTVVATTSIAKNTGSASPTAELRSNGVTVTFAGSADSRILAGTSPGVVNQVSGDNESKITPGDELVLHPGEGIALYQEQVNGDANSRYHFFLEWKEVSTSTPAQFISFTISTSSIFLGTVSPTIARYASSTNTLGSATEVEAHTLSVISNATNGYTVSAKGQTLTSGTTTIAAIGGTATTSLVGTEQFGIRLVATGGSGTSTSPYDGNNFAYAATATTSSQVANATTGDNAKTTFSVRYLANIAPTTLPAAYTANIIYVVTANF